MFLGPNTYISPAWYATKRETGKVVPTWNYVAIHAYGEVRFFEDAEPLLQLVTRLTATHEAGRPEPWAVSDAPAEFIRGQLKGIVGFELPIVAARRQMEDEPEPDGGGSRGRDRGAAARGRRGRGGGGGDHGGGGTVMKPLPVAPHG